MAAVLGLALLGCTGDGDDATGAPAVPTAPRGEPLTSEEYVTESHAACDAYLGALFSLVRDDDQLDVDSEDASTELFSRRAADIATLFAAYRSRIDALRPPDDADVVNTHEEVVELMSRNGEVIRALGEAHARGDGNEADALLAESSRIEEQIAARHTALGIRPCGR